MVSGPSAAWSGPPRGVRFLRNPSRNHQIEHSLPKKGRSHNDLNRCGSFTSDFEAEGIRTLNHRIDSAVLIPSVELETRFRYRKGDSDATRVNPRTRYCGVLSRKCRVTALRDQAFMAS
jgi:hypothetical protein